MLNLAFGRQAGSPFQKKTKKIVKSKTHAKRWIEVIACELSQGKGGRRRGIAGTQGRPGRLSYDSASAGGALLIRV